MRECILRQAENLNGYWKRRISIAVENDKDAHTAIYSWANLEADVEVKLVWTFRLDIQMDGMQPVWADEDRIQYAL